MDLSRRLRSSLVALLPFTAFVAVAACDNGKKEDAPAAASSAAASASAHATATPAAEAPPSTPKPGGLPAPPDVAAPPADAAKTTSGLASKVLTPGKGDKKPGPHDRVKVHYTGWMKNGEMFDSSVTRGEPATFPLDSVIPGWTEGLQLMVAGEKRRLWIPAKMAYGEVSHGGAPSGDLVFDVELLEITVAPPPPTVPEDVKAAPASAKKTASGLAYRVLKQGTGKENPKASSVVTVHYSGWTPDGKMFDSSVTRGEPASFPLGNVIKGWTEGVQLMKQGEKTRFWIPSDMAYGDKPRRPGAPAGPLVFDIELISFR